MREYGLTLNALETSRGGPDSFDIIELNYDSERNVMIGEFGEIVFDIHRIVPPALLSIFKKTKQNMSRWDNHGNLIVLLYPERRSECSEW